jgi:hypothetical protein
VVEYYTCIRIFMPQAMRAAPEYRNGHERVLRKESLVPGNQGPKDTAMLEIVGRLGSCLDEDHHPDNDDGMQTRIRPCDCSSRPLLRIRRTPTERFQASRIMEWLAGPRGC